MASSNADYRARHPLAAVHSDECNSTLCPCYLAGLRAGFDDGVAAREPLTDEAWRPFADALGIDPPPPNDGSAP